MIPQPQELNSLLNPHPVDSCTIYLTSLNKLDNITLVPQPQIQCAVDQEPSRKKQRPPASNSTSKVTKEDARNLKKMKISSQHIALIIENNEKRFEDSALAFGREKKCMINPPQHKPTMPLVDNFKDRIILKLMNIGNYARIKVDYSPNKNHPSRNG